MSEKKRKNPDCPCVYKSCPRNGVCAECVKYHRAHGGLTACGK